MIIINYIYMSLYQILAIVLPVITIPYVSRILGANGLGIYALSFSYAQIFSLIGMVGLSAYSCREVAYVREDIDKLSKEFWEINFARFITVGISLILYLIFTFFVIHLDRQIYLLQSLIILSSLIDISWLFIGLENFKIIIFRNTIIKLIGIVLIFIFVKNINDVWIYTLILGGSQLLGQFIMWRDLPKGLRFVLPNIKDVCNHVKNSIGLFIPQVAIYVYTVLDKVMLGTLSDAAQVGMYDNSQKVVKLLAIIVTSLSVVMVPKMANLFKNNQNNEFKDNVYKSFSFVSFLAFPMTFGILGISTSFVPIFYGAGFINMIPMFNIATFLIITLGWTSILGNQVLISIKREKQFTIAVTIGAIVNIISNLLLINKLGGLGATISSVITEYIGAVFMLWFLRDIVNIKQLFRPIPKYLISSLLMYLVVIMVGKTMRISIPNLTFQIVVGFIIYILIMILSKDKNLTYGIRLIKNFFFTNEERK